MRDSASESRSVFILGLPRSGTTWLAKIFDSHPETLYRREPDIIHRDEVMPFSCTRESAPAYIGAMQARLHLFLNDRSVRTVGSRPVFAKSFHTKSQTAFRRAVIRSLKAVGRIPPASEWANSLQVPDFCGPNPGAIKCTIIKSVSAALGRVEIIKAAAPEMRFIHLHPPSLRSNRIDAARRTSIEI